MELGERQRGTRRTYKGDTYDEASDAERKLIGTRVAPAKKAEIDTDARAQGCANRQEWLEAAAELALERPDLLATVLRRLRSQKQQQLAFDTEEVLKSA